MDLDTQRLMVRQFYEEQYENLSEMVWYSKREGFSPPFERIASVTIGELSPLEVEIERINQNVPQSVSDAFARHLWYSQWNFAYLFLVKVPINEQSFFFLFHLGISDDAWDNDTSLVEIFNEQGEFVDATDSTFYQVLSMKWNEKPFTHEDCRDGKTNEPPPPWSGDDPNAVYYSEPLWTEEMLIREGAKVEEKETLTRYVGRW
ncbi:MULTISPECIES: hypothetical protein [Calothrix]|uniref:Uncharacterized protein n=2 Tax=Calothrix TaxID=1186 RepID=A0ABR8AGH4_9CYAN|nr:MULTISPECIES: hypothetical protein [Calothrix]MBD2198849.1 hypothetical protein [Calothrix parietina FACHB-288]MBD2227576.1 hypothetical protein [Calothrix anomala FACHB-343]